MQFWHKKNLISYSLLPISLMFKAIAQLRKSGYQYGLVPSKKFNVPVIVIGNIEVGGTGKTPLTIHIANLLQQHGYNPGIVSRGYGGKSAQYPLEVIRSSDPQLVGDEACMIVNNTACPMVVDPNRVNAVNHLLENYTCDVILSDDGLQHYALKRDIEIAVVNQLQNPFCLPAGPLREPISRLHTVDFVVNSNRNELENYLYSIALIPQYIEAIANQQRFEVSEFKNKKCHAVVAIGNPQRFFNTLNELDISFEKHVFKDHYRFQKQDLIFNDDLPVIMTEKDAVKCKSFNLSNLYYLKMTTSVSHDFDVELLELIKKRS